MTHAAILDAIDETNTRVPALDPLRATVGDELQGIYATLGDALTASYVLRGPLLSKVELRFGLRTGIADERDVANPLTVTTVRMVDAHISRLQDGARHALRSLLDGHNNRTAARLAGTSLSANS